ncbi:hypothetical protein GBAR_LOCUS9403 [Geodia barretti]|uniref:Methyltransferase domain-containing protein n=1 Tax=Geodia barretti TaxID=519541 RepID=A0AA35RR74_GEOBA|nr:hypothetical protein GBAR_LOCUS9403 [Geodia barretti]
MYRSFWDSEGSLHWGIFDKSSDESPAGDSGNVRAGFLSACSRLNEIMLANAGIDGDARVLDLGCGNGNTAMWLSRATGAKVTGVDLSGVRIANAIESLQKSPDLAKTLQEAYRVLRPSGTMVFDDLIKPKPDISDEARAFVYDRLLFDTDFSFYSYMDALRETGFRVLEARDLSAHLARSYGCLSEMAASADDAARQERFTALSDAYLKMVNAVQNAELGWAQYLCVK